jgi:predicted nucleic acid-binding protein
VDERKVLDTSAVIALLCDEEGADIVEGCLNKARKGSVRLYISFAAIAEVFSIAARRENKNRAEFYVAVIKSWPVPWIHSSEELCLSAGILKAQYRLSFADAFIAATAIHLDAVLIHKDPEFEALRSVLQMEILPYKNR